MVIFSDMVPLHECPCLLNAVDVGGGKPIQRGLINPEGDQSVFGDETAEVMESNGAMIVPQDIKPKQTVRQDFGNV